jgi:hypothetical protein
LSGGFDAQPAKNTIPTTGNSSQIIFSIHQANQQHSPESNVAPN